MWTFEKSTLINEAGLWKSEDTWNLVTLQPEIFKTNAPNGESDMISYMPNKQGGSKGSKS